MVTLNTVPESTSLSISNRDFNEQCLNYQILHKAVEGS